MNYNPNQSIVGGKNYTAVAINIASMAGEWIKSRLGAHEHLNQKQSSRDLVTEVDKGAETLIRNLLRTHFPNHAVLGEEGVAPGSAAAVQALEEAIQEEYLWIVDPIDGTTNFIHGFPFYSISIALAYRGEVIVGVIYDPTLNEMFVAEKDKGAYVHGKRMAVSREDSLGESLVATGYPADTQTELPMALNSLQILAPQVRGIRSIGSAAMHLAYVAAGRLSGFWHIGLSSWDIAAGALLVQESGGKISDISGAPYSIHTRNVLASNGNIHHMLEEQLKQALN